MTLKTLWLENETRLWKQGLIHIAGLDEAGRGPLAGPVVAAAVVFPPHTYIEGVNDSKKLSPKKRDELALKISKTAICVNTGIVHEREIDQINILQATYQAMRQAIKRLKVQPQHLLVDGYAIPNMQIAQTAIPQGDSQVFSIAAASIIAKVTRDQMMYEYDAMFPEYGFAKHKGYPTRQHVEAIAQFGPCPIHRESFKVKGWPKIS